MTVHPDLRAVVDAVKMQPCVPPLVAGGHIHCGSVPVAGLVQTLRNRPHVFAIQRFGIYPVIDERREYGSGYSCGIPSLRLESGTGDDPGVSASFARILHQPALNIGSRWRTLCT